MSNQQENNEADRPASDDNGKSSELDRVFVYQNKSTGKPSTVTLSTHQLCRILCPATSNNKITVSKNIQGSTLVLGYNPKNGTYDEGGWTAANQVPILKEACTDWYYCSTNQQQKVEGPVSCRVLAKLIHEGTIAVETTKVIPSSATDPNSWKFLQDEPHLMAALDAFASTATPPAVDKKKPVQSGSESKLQQHYDASVMTYNGDELNGSKNNDSGITDKEKEVQDELEAFLSSTADDTGHNKKEEEEEEYTSDGGTSYAKCPQTGKWIHSDLIKKPPTQPEKKRPAPTTRQEVPLKKKRPKKPKFAAKNAKCWIYVTGLPKDCTETEVAKFFSKVGILDLNPETQAPKVKLYREKDNNDQLKGDASVCFARPESVELALQLLDESPFRTEDNGDNNVIRIQRAKFEQHGDVFERKGAVSNAKRKVAKLAAIQAMDWDEDTDNGRISGGRKGLCIIVLKHMFDPSQLQAETEDKVLEGLEQDVKSTCQEWGTVEKITVFSKHPEGVVIVKFSQPTAASTAIQEYSGQPARLGNNKSTSRTIQASFWDGVTDYTVRDEAKEQVEQEKRHEEFGTWLESQQVPDELKLQVEG